MCRLYGVTLMKLASWLIRTAPLNCVHRTVAKTYAFTLCLRGQVWTVLYSSGAGSLEPSASNSLVACGRGMATQLPVSDCAGLLSSARCLDTGRALSRNCSTGGEQCSSFSDADKYHMVQGQVQQIP